MISTEDARAFLESQAAEFKSMSYEELSEYAKTHGLLDEWKSRELVLDGVNACVNTMMGKRGLRRKRISVEMHLRRDSDKRGRAFRAFTSNASSPGDSTCRRKRRLKKRSSRRCRTFSSL